MASVEIDSAVRCTHDTDIVDLDPAPVYADAWTVIGDKETGYALGLAILITDEDLGEKYEVVIPLPALAQAVADLARMAESAAKELDEDTLYRAAYAVRSR